MVLYITMVNHVLQYWLYPGNLLDLSVVLCGNNNCYSVEYFLLNEVSGIVYAYGHTSEIQESQHVCQFAGHHLLVHSKVNFGC